MRNFLSYSKKQLRLHETQGNGFTKIVLLYLPH